MLTAQTEATLIESHMGFVFVCFFHDVRSRKEDDGVTCMSLRSSNFNDKHAAILAQAMAFYVASLKYLDLSDVELTPDGYRALRVGNVRFLFVCCSMEIIRSRRAKIEWKHSLLHRLMCGQAFNCPVLSTWRCATTISWTQRRDCSC